MLHVHVMLINTQVYFFIGVLDNQTVVFVGVLLFYFIFYGLKHPFQIFGMNLSSHFSVVLAQLYRK